MRAYHRKDHVFLTPERKSALVTEALAQLIAEGSKTATLAQVTARAAQICNEKGWGQVSLWTIDNFIRMLSPEMSEVPYLKDALASGAFQWAKRGRARVRTIRPPSKIVDYPTVIANLPPGNRSRKAIAEATGLAIWKIDCYLFENPAVAKLLDST